MELVLVVLAMVVTIVAIDIIARQEQGATSDKIVVDTTDRD